VPKPNYAFAKRQRDLAKKQKKEAKRQKKAEAAQATTEAHADSSVGGNSDPAQPDSSRAL
jgi:hypothetical protein